MTKNTKQWAPSIVIALVLSLFIRAYVAEAVRVPSGSMIPTIQINDYLIIEKMMWLTKPKHGDIIVFFPPTSNDRYVKRLIGLPGDTIEVKNGELYRNQEPVDEPYINEKMTYTFGPVLVPEDDYLFLGDNRNTSNDSHAWSTPFVHEDQLIGKVILELPTHHFLK